MLAPPFFNECLTIVRTKSIVTKYEIAQFHNDSNDVQ